MVKIIGYKHIGKIKTYDLEVNHKDHQFYLSNGLLTSNSHAVSYAIDSYQCAWLLSKYESEWLCAYMETQANDPDSRSQAISELKSFGYEITNVDINFATEKWTIIPGKKFMPSLTTVKGVGSSAVSEIMNFRPYRSIEDLLWNSDGTWRHSKFNKRALDHLIKIRAFASMDIIGENKPFSSYKHMYACLVEDNAKLKHKKHGKEELKARMLNKVDEWTKKELVEFSKELVGSYDISLVLSNQMKSKLDELNVKAINEYTEQGLYWFIVESTQIKTSRNKKDFLLITASGSSGKQYKIYCWGFNNDKHSIVENTAYIGELSKTQFGFSTHAFKLKSISRRK